MAAIMVTTMPQGFGAESPPAWLSLAYGSIFSMLVRLRVLVSRSRSGRNRSRHQIQLLQPFFGLALAALLLGEPVAWSMIAATPLVVVACRRQAILLSARVAFRTVDGGTFREPAALDFRCRNNRNIKQRRRHKLRHGGNMRLLSAGLAASHWLLPPFMAPSRKHRSGRSARSP